ncbi:MAG: 4a-hydroxytetrahydrobiopterin dehydratase [Acidimicrobiales bacterium]
MTELRPLTSEELDQAARDLPLWDVSADRFRRELRFGDFAEAFGFMTEVAVVAEAMNHHPEWSNVYQRVTVELRTHDVDGVSALDITLARRIDVAVTRRS